MTGTMAPGETHIWHAQLDPPGAAGRQMARLLSADERARAARFRDPRLRARFAAARGALRSVLGLYLDTPAAALRFEYGAHGKPHLASPQNPHRVAFNLSHSGPVALIAITSDRAVGIDVERIRPGVEVMALAERFFCAEEAREIRRLAPALRVQAFHACWTRKEAVIKAWGDGLFARLNGFRVSTEPAGPARLLSTDRGPAEASRWSLADLATEAGYRAALAVEGHSGRLHYYRWCWSGAVPDVAD